VRKREEEEEEKNVKMQHMGEIIIIKVINNK